MIEIVECPSISLATFAWTKVVMFGTPRVAIVKRGRLYVFVVEAYLRDFMVAAKRIERELLKLKSPTIPPPD